jgi:hypothetical protein
MTENGFLNIVDVTDTDDWRTPEAIPRARSRTPRNRQRTGLEGRSPVPEYRQRCSAFSIGNRLAAIRPIHDSQRVTGKQNSQGSSLEASFGWTRRGTPWASGDEIPPYWSIMIVHALPPEMTFG